MVLMVQVTSRLYPRVGPRRMLAIGVAVLTTVLTQATAMYAANGTGTGATAQVQLLAFHDAFAVSILFGVLGILFALRIHDQDAAAALSGPPRRRELAMNRT